MISFNSEEFSKSYANIEIKDKNYSESKDLSKSLTIHFSDFFRELGGIKKDLFFANEYSNKFFNNPQKVMAWLEEKPLSKSSLVYFSHLKRLELKLAYLTDQQFMICLKACPGLEELDLSGSNVTDSVLAHLPKKLKILNISLCQKITHIGLSHLKSLIALRKLVLMSHPLNPITPISFVYLKTLVTLNKLVFYSSRQVSNEDMAHLQTLKNLRKLCLSGCIVKINDEGIGCLNSFNHLKSLELVGNDEITDKGLASFNFKGLNRLTLTSFELITDECIPHLKSLLNKIDLAACRHITPEGRKTIELEWDKDNKNKGYRKNNEIR